MDPVRPQDQWPGDGDHHGIETAWVSVSPKGLWNVQQKQSQKDSKKAATNPGEAQSCNSSPRLGSLCHVRVQLKGDGDELDGSVSTEEDAVLPDQSEWTSSDVKFPRCQDSVLQVPLGKWTVMRIGEGQCDITEACVERMTTGEKCEIYLSPVVNGPDASVTKPAEENLPLIATVELQGFTEGKESWEMSPGEKWEWVKSGKERGGVRFRSGDVWGAADSYSRALKILITLCGHIEEIEKKEQQMLERRDTNNCNQTAFSANEFKTIKAELHSNLSLCQLKLNQPERAKASAAKATMLEPGGAKAWYRLGQACQMVNELEEAKQAFRKLLKLQPESSAALKALKDIASRQKEVNSALGQRLSKMFS